MRRAAALARAARVAAAGALVASACAMCAGCSHAELDRAVSKGTPTSVDLQDVPVHGFPVEVEQVGGRPSVSGELLAADAAGLWVRDERGSVWIEAHHVRQVRVQVYSSLVGEVVGLSVGGAVSTLSNGAFLIFTAPGWLVAGLSAGTYEGSANVATAEPHDTPSLYQYARFPAGLPRQWFRTNQQ
jgi:hypothetical protein